MRRLLIAAALLAAAGATAGDLYRWVDPQGVVHYGDYPKVEDAERVKINLQPVDEAASGVSADVPYEARLAAQHFPVTLFVFEGCDDLCKQARAYLKKRRVPYSEHVLKTQADFEALKKQAGIGGLPSLTVGTKWLTGFQPEVWGGELDAAGYPK
jgi:glutaredoxin